MFQKPFVVIGMENAMDLFDLMRAGYIKKIMPLLSLLNAQHICGCF